MIELYKKILKEAYNIEDISKIPSLGEIVQREIYHLNLKDYTFYELKKLNEIIDHKRDLSISYSALVFWAEKYLLQNRVSKVVYETPQVAFMLISMMFFYDVKNKEERINKIVKFYHYLSTYKINLPTPIISSLRSIHTKQYSSCTLLKVGDSINSISESVKGILKYATNKAGLGIDISDIRAINQPIRGGDAYHTGCVPYVKLFESALQSASQGGIRKGSATVFFQWWHMEFTNLIELKNNRGTPETRARNLDYSVLINKFFLEKAIRKETVYLFSPEEVPNLKEAFYDPEGSYEKFLSAYEEAVDNPNISKVQMNAYDMLIKIMQERILSGRVYITFIDNLNKGSSFNIPINQSNLCMEIALPTSPIEENGEGLISLCTLSAMNWGKFEHYEEMEEPIKLLVEALNNLLDFQKYLMPQSKKATKLYNPLGVGVTNFAYWLAKKGYSYSNNNAIAELHEWAEAQYYYLLKASIDIAKERGASEGIKDCIYSEGKLVFDKQNKLPIHDGIKLKQDWNTLREDMKKYGVRNCTLGALMPVESSSVISESTNGIEPIRNLVTYKTSKSGKIAFEAPEHDFLKDKYDLLWNITSPKYYLNMVATFQKFTDMSISTNTTYNPKFYEGNQIKMSELIKDVVECYKKNIKTLYYNYVNDMSKDDFEMLHSFDPIVKNEANKELEQESEDCGCIL